MEFFYVFFLFSVQCGEASISTQFPFHFCRLLYKPFLLISKAILLSFLLVHFYLRSEARRLFLSPFHDVHIDVLYFFAVSHTCIPFSFASSLVSGPSERCEAFVCNPFPFQLYRLTAFLLCSSQMQFFSLSSSCFASSLNRAEASVSNPFPRYISLLS